MTVTIDGTTGVAAPAFNGTIDAADITSGNLPADRITTALNVTGSAPMYACRAWVNFNGTGSVSTNQTIRQAGNVASVFKNATGVYTITFTTAMPTTNYAVFATAQRTTTTAPVYVGITPGVNPGSASVQITVAATAANIEDSGIVTVAIFC